MEIEARPIAEGEPLPLVVQPASSGDRNVDALAGWLRESADWLEDRLHEHGGVLLRGFPVDDDSAFRLVASAAIPELKAYVEGQSPRTKLVEGVYTSTEYPARFDVTLHSELSYTSSPPPRLIFGCQIAPEQGGETPIVDCRKVCARLDRAVREKFESRGVRYVTNLQAKATGIGKSWQDYFESSDASFVEEYLRARGTEFRWLDDGGLWTAQTRPGFREHPVTGEKVWANQSNLWHVSNFPRSTQAQLLKHFGEERLPTHAYYGDGSPIELAELDHVRSVLWENASTFAWQRGDVLVLDNCLVAHGRKAFEGPRKVVVAMG